MRASTLIVAVVVILVITYLIWQVINSNKAGKARQDRSKRRSDRVKLGRAGRRAYKQAHELYKAGNFKACAKILESLGLLRESINVLERAGLYREAADALLRIQRPNRAGHLLARNGLWKEALEAYKKANMPQEIGRCYRELGDLPTAIPFFLEAGAKQEAADCLVEVGKHQEAARLFIKMQNYDRAIDQYINLVDSSSDLEKLDFLEDELNLITNKLVDGTAEIRLTDILVAKKKATGLLIGLIKVNNLRAATEAYMRNTTDVGPALIGFAEFDRDQQFLLASLFINVGAFEYSGIVYERLQEWNKAAEAFEKGEYYERAAACYERASNKEKSTMMRITIASKGSGEPKPLPRIEVSEKRDPSNPFSIQDTEPNDISRFQSDLKPRSDPQPTETMMLVNGDEDTQTGELPKTAAPASQIDWVSFFQADFIRDLNDLEQRQLQSICETEDFAPGEVILDFKQEPLGIYFVLSGRISIVKKGDNNQETEIDFFEKGDTFGELWLLMDQPTQFKFLVKEPSTLGWIRRPAFESLMDTHGAIARKLYKSFAHTLVSRLLNNQQKKKNALAS